MQSFHSGGIGVIHKVSWGSCDLIDRREQTYDGNQAQVCAILNQHCGCCYEARLCGPVQCRLPVLKIYIGQFSITQVEIIGRSQTYLILSVHIGSESPNQIVNKGRVADLSRNS